MANYKPVDYSPRLLPVILEQQLQPGSFEHAINYLIDHQMPEQLAAFDRHYHNHKTGAPAYDPAMLLKVILFAYSRGLISSRDIERACREQVTFIALSGDSQPHFTTIASFIRLLGEDIQKLFARILWLCDRQGLIGRQMFAIDGVKLPSNASKHRSGTRADFQRQAAKLEAAVGVMLQRHRSQDEQPETAPSLPANAQRKLERLQKEAATLRQWLVDHPDDKPGASGKPRKSNLTDNDSAKMATEKGIIQGYNGLATVDDQHQIIVDAQAWGNGSEQGVIVSLAERLREKKLLQRDTVITADSGFHSKKTMQALADIQVNALIADKEMRLRDERLQGREVHKPAKPVLHRKRSAAEIDTSDVRTAPLYQVSDFVFDPIRMTCVCPAGKRLYRDGQNCFIRGQRAIKFRGSASACGPCSQRERCLQNPQQKTGRQVAFFQGKTKNERVDCPVTRMRNRIDSPEGRAIYDRRLATVEPVFGNLRYNKKLNRFTLRGIKKVDTQWQLFCLVHNIEKLAKHGIATNALAKAA